MPKVKQVITNFTAGALSPKVRGRIDLERYNNGAKRLFNCYPIVQGGVKRRPGTRYVSSIPVGVADLTCEGTYGETFFTEFFDTFGTDGALSGASAETSPDSGWTYSATSAVRSGGRVSPATFTCSGGVSATAFRFLVSVNIASGETLTMTFDGSGYSLQVVLALGAGAACSFSFVGASETRTDTFSIGSTPGAVTFGFDGLATYIDPDMVMNLYLAPDFVSTPAATITEGLDSFPAGYTQCASFEFSCTGSNSSVNFIRMCGNSGG